MSSEFFTNKKENTLKNKINHILSHDKNINYLDFLIGYFRMSGFDKIASSLKNIEHTRILIGISTDKATFEASELISQFAKAQIEFCDENYNNFISMKELIQSKKITIKITPYRDVHSKMYIMRSEGIQKHDKSGKSYLGSVIIGSSNLTHNGLEKNREINAELKDNKNIEDALTLFEDLWKESVELTENDFEKHFRPHLKPPLPTNKNITPYQLYIKLLIEHFGTRIDFLNDAGIIVPNEYKKLSYQIEAVNEGIEKLELHNGFFLSDVVGLGKTVVIAMLLKKIESTLSQKVLIVIPPAVKIQWEETMQEFEFVPYTIISLASLHKINAKEYQLIIVDESHKFKNKNATRYKQLANICLNKKVILLSATPQNNTPNDLYNQIALFQNTKVSSIESCRNLEAFFKQKELEFKSIINADTLIDTIALKKLSKEIRDSVLREIMIRRTRYDISHHNMYKKDIKKQNLSIPKVLAPNEHQYSLDKELAIIFKITAKEISKELDYSRFNALSYLTKEAREQHYPKESSNIFDKNPLAGIMKTLLIKRFESSFDAFKISIARHLKRYETFIANFKENRVYLGKKSSDILDYDENNDEDYEDFIQKLDNEGKIRTLNRNDFKENFLDDLIKDYTIFQRLVERWKNIDTDPKLARFKEEVKKEKLVKNNKKIVVFTESIDTLEYIKKSINSDKILFVTSQNREEIKQKIQENFDANYSIEKQKNDYNMIVTTDTLAEGINLHRSNIIYNYDIPWNATKLIQRIGRVNRIGTKEDFIHIHNFKPTEEIETVLKLSQKAFVKLQSSHSMMGEDNQIYSNEESVGSVTLFDEYQKELNERDEILDYLEELREFRDNNKAEFEAIKKLENPSVCRLGEVKNSYIALEVNKNKRYLSLSQKDIKPITFVSMAKALQAERSEKSMEGEEIDTSRAIKFIEDEIKRKKQDKAEGNISDKESQTSIIKVKEYLKHNIIEKDFFDEIKEAIEEGLLGMPSIKKMQTLEKNENKDIQKILKELMQNIKNKKQTSLFDTPDIRVKLSETFIREI